jgi:hypothetical protein
MKQLPIVVGLTLCEELDVSLRPGKVALVGIFQALRFRSFPGTPTSFTVFVSMTDGLGEGRMELVVTRLETGQDIHRKSRWLAFSPDRLSIVHLEIRLTDSVFPAPGRYSLSLSIDDARIAERSLTVFAE